MRFSFKKTHLLLCLFALVITYLAINTGIISDDFEAMATKSNKYYMELPVMYITHLIWYPFFHSDNQAVVNVLKIAYLFISFYFISCFFRIFMDEEYAMLASFIFLFFPSHDATTYWFMGQYLTLSFAFYLFAFYLAGRNRPIPAFICALAASFISYGSTPLAIGLFVLFLLRREPGKGMLILIPNIIYAAYFVPLNIIMRAGTPRIVEAFSLSAFLKQFVLQVLTFFDAMFGPSMWLKVYYAFPQLSATSIFAAAALFLVFCKMKNRSHIDRNLALSLTIILLLALAMFAATGRYPQIAFNLGNRVTIYGALLLSYLIVAMPMPRLLRITAIGLVLFSAFGISDHWKAWNAHQVAVIRRIEKSDALKSYDDKRTVYVSGNQYSKYGPLGHIEFLSETAVTWFVFKLASGGKISADTLNRRFNYSDGKLTDTKYGFEYPVDGYINVYDSENDVISKVDIGEINRFIERLPADDRHWIQLLKDCPLRDMVLRLMPRLKYAFFTR